MIVCQRLSMFVNYTLTDFPVRLLTISQASRHRTLFGSALPPSPGPGTTLLYAHVPVSPHARVIMPRVQ
jgi:hypothetical protein